ncbi:MAG: ATPase [Candidatus Sulfotelmatobacter sp.]
MTGKSATRIVRTLFFSGLMLCCAGLIPGSAQEPGSVPEQSQPEAGPKQNQPEAEPKQNPPGPARQLVHQSREAAGEEKDEMAEFKHSASVQLIARLTGLNLQQSYWLSVIFNFAVIATLIIWAARKYLPGIFRDRTTAIQKAMQEAQQASQEARKKLAEIESRLQQLDVEIGKIRDAIEKDGAAEEVRIQAAAEEDARKIVASAEQEIAAAAKAARRQLTSHAADLAVGLAQKQIHVDAATDQNLVRAFAGQLAAVREGSRKDRN